MAALPSRRAGIYPSTKPLPDGAFPGTGIGTGSRSVSSKKRSGRKKTERGQRRAGARVAQDATARGLDARFRYDCRSGILAVRVVSAAWVSLRKRE